MKEDFNHSLENELESWGPIAEVKRISDCALDIFVNDLFPYEESDKKLSEEEYTKECEAIFRRTFTSKHKDPERFTGAEVEEDFFNTILSSSSDPEERQEYLNTSLYHLLNIVCMYLCDAVQILKDIEANVNTGSETTADNSIVTNSDVFYYLCRCNYFLGLCKAAYASKIGAKVQVKENMTKLAEKKNKHLREQLEKDLNIVKKIWDENNWPSFTKCANYIFEKKVIDRPYRKISELVSLAAKK